MLTHALRWRPFVFTCALSMFFFCAYRAPRAQSAGYLLSILGPGLNVDGMNSHGDTIGYRPSGGWFIWNPGTGVLVEHPYGDGLTYSSGFWFNPNRLAINSAGAVGGTGKSPRGWQPSFRAPGATWQLTGNFSDEAVIGGTLYGGAVAMNDAGQVVGYSQGGGYNSYGPFIWSASSGLRMLRGFEPDPLFSRHGVAYDINNRGQVTGVCGGAGCSGSGGGYGAFLWSDEAGFRVIRLGAPDAYFYGHAVNDRGVVVGVSQRAGANGSSIWGAFRWSETAGVEDLNIPPGSPDRLDINTAGDIVVSIIGLQGGSRAFLRRHDSETWIDLRSFVPEEGGFRPDYAVAINDKGMIAGYGTYSSVGYTHGFVLTPGATTPELPANTAPVANAGFDRTLGADNDCTRLVLLDARGSADADNDTLSYQWKRGSELVGTTATLLQTLGSGTHTYTVIVDDGRGLTASDDVVITVRDDASPALTVPAAATIEQASAAGSMFTPRPASVVDNCTASPTVTAVPGAGVFPPGTSVITYTARDDAGNSVSHTSTVTVRDTTAPIIRSVQPDRASVWPANHKLVPITVRVSSEDAVSSPVCEIVSVSSNEPADSVGDGNTDADWSFAGLSAQLRAERSGRGTDRIYTLRISCRDEAGNLSSQSTTVTVPHSQGRK